MTYDGRRMRVTFTVPGTSRASSLCHEILRHL